MFDRDESSFGAFLLTFGLGFVAGAAVALLYTPMSGKRLQRKVSDVTEKVIDSVEEKINDVQAAVRKIKRA